MEEIQKEVIKTFGNECIMTGDEIKTTLNDIYQHYNVRFYPEIKALEKFGYSLDRFLENGKFKYKIVKI
jgi:hypothetical protein